MHTLAQLRSGELAGSRHLKLAAGLCGFPEEIYSLADTLEVLDLSGNQLTDLPGDLHRFSQLKILFASDNQFEHIPEGVGLCHSLTMVGFKHNKIRDVSATCLPPNVRWLILTDNCISQLPGNFGNLSALEKLMLAGNRLTALPNSISRLNKLGLLRISANQFDVFPDQLLELPNLAWLAFSGNPFCPRHESHHNVLTVARGDLEMGDVLGRGASGVISRAYWQSAPAGIDPDVAVKVFHGGVTSDGYPQDELAACLSVAPHPNLVTALAQVTEPAFDALVMKLIPHDYSNLGQPPSLDSCTRDTFTAGQALSRELADCLIKQMTSLVEHLEATQICHGDVYAHNTLINADGHLLFGDFGAASRYHNLTDAQQAGIRKIERRALGYFIEDMEGLVSLGCVTIRPC
ncbi:leucine-rich repeat-containing protein kinase family protein [Candidatus Thalassolituus haligoni]|uniref:leucine-rich repeat-containing protein kinase family protein n=1 Tax=Candidatus Thalassolituus haligoni TaxID=3100113 RepID=UPI0035133144|tara:strand:- start:5153 stop:6367 length:1215 start_codon:yes stop_codon:yes gene_type:complete